MCEDQESSAELLEQLKRLYKAAGFRYIEIAGRLDLSEATVKRLMNGRGLTLAMLNRLCSIVDISLFELVELAQREQRPAVPAVTLGQAQALAGDVVLGTIFFLLDRGWDASRIAEEFDLDEIIITRHLIRLDAIGVIALFPANRLRLLRRMSKNLRYRLAGSDMINARVTGFLSSFDANSADALWTSGIARLSPASYSQVSELLDNLRDALFALGEHDFGLPRDQVHWYLMFAGVRPIEAATLLSGEPLIDSATE